MEFLLYSDKNTISLKCATVYGQINNLDFPLFASIVNIDSSEPSENK